MQKHKNTKDKHSKAYTNLKIQCTMINERTLHEQKTYKHSPGDRTDVMSTGS